MSKEFKSTLEREIGLDEVVPSSPANYNSAPVTSTNQSPPVDPSKQLIYFFLDNFIFFVVGLQ